MKSVSRTRSLGRSALRLSLVGAATLAIAAAGAAPASAAGTKSGAAKQVKKAPVVSGAAWGHRGTMWG